LLERLSCAMVKVVHLLVRVWESTFCVNSLNWPLQ